MIDESSNPGIDDYLETFNDWLVGVSNEFDSVDDKVNEFKADMYVAKQLLDIHGIPTDPLDELIMHKMMGI